MSLEFQEEEVRPGEKAHLLIQAPVSSYVGIVAVDQSVYLQQDKNQLTTAKVTLYVLSFLNHSKNSRLSFSCMMRLDSLMSTSHWPSRDTFVAGMHTGTVSVTAMDIQKEEIHLFHSRDLSLQ